MTAAAIALSVAYVAVAALLLNLNLGTRWSLPVKIGAIVAVTGLYAVAWHGHKALMGWASGDPLPDDFRVHWVTIDEPDKETGASSTIYFWVRALDAAGLPEGEPRAYRVPWDEATAEAAEAALAQLESGELLNGRISRQIVDPDAEPRQVEGADYAGDSLASATSGVRPRFEFSRVPPPTLPPKPLPDP